MDAKETAGEARMEITSKLAEMRVSTDLLKWALHLPEDVAIADIGGYDLATETVVVTLRGELFSHEGDCPIAIKPRASKFHFNGEQLIAWDWGIDDQ